jgi:peptidoglycan/LPS O-acetylase OafA/YrhL
MKEKFHSFDALRFFSFFFVFLSHLPYTLFPNYIFLKTKGDIGVDFFFLISGFLITYIILVEKKENSNFNFKKYFIRRILRIWPLYYFVILFAILTPYILSILGLASTNIGYKPNWWYSSLFLENYMIIQHNDFANVSPLPVLWSLCIEEHFYIIWGVLLFFSNIKKVPYWIITIIIISNISRLYFFQNHLLFKEILTNFDFFMYGAIPAYLYLNHKEKTIAFINKVPNILKTGIILFTLVFVFAANHYTYFAKSLVEANVLGILFSMILFIILPQNNNFKIKDISLFSKLGIYTYGLYVFHPITINLSIQLYNKSGLQLSETILFISILFFSLITVILASYISYNFYEKPFLKLKSKFQY